MKGKHGTFEIAGVPKAVLAEFSQRRAEILERATHLGIKSPEGLREITKRSRDPKPASEDGTALKQEGASRPAAPAFAAKPPAPQAEPRAASPPPDRQTGRATWRKRGER